MRFRFSIVASATVALFLTMGLMFIGCGDDTSSPTNDPPEITNLTADPATVEPTGITTITCTSNDPDGNELTYTWTAGAGTLSGTGATVTWRAPAGGGSYTVSVTVDDGQGGSVSDSAMVEVTGGTLLVHVRNAILGVDLSGGYFQFYNGGGNIEVAGTRVFIGPSSVQEIDHSGNQIVWYPRPAEAPSRVTAFASLPEVGHVFMENWGDTLTFMGPTGDFIENVVMPGASDINQGMYGVVVDDKLVISETGTQELVQVDLATREASIFKDLSHLGKWLGDIDYGSGYYYMLNKRERIYKFTETDPEELVIDLPDRAMLHLAVVGTNLYATDRDAGRIYRIDTMTGTEEVFVEGLDEPRDIEFLPVELQGP